MKAESAGAVKPRFFPTAAALRAWFAKHAASSPELLVGFYKLGSGRPSVTWPEAVDEALCVGWIDGVRKRIDEVSYQIRFMPRRATSIWSAVNIANYERLEAQEKIKAAGREAFAARSEAKSRTYAYEQQAAAALSPAEEATRQARLLRLIAASQAGERL